MDTRLLRIFRAIARHASVGAAAAELSLTPSALSHSLRALETEVGCRLFDRVGRRLVLNQAGEHLLEAIEGPLLALEKAAVSLKELGRWGQGRLRIGAPASACQYLVPAVLNALRKEFPKLQLHVESGDMPHLLGVLRDRHVDLAIGVEPEPGSDLKCTPLFEDELCFVFSPRHSWADDDHPLVASEIARQTFILYQRTGPTARLVTRYFQEQGCEPGTTMAVASLPAIKELVRMNLGIGIMAPWVAENELTRGTLCLRPPGSRAWRRRWVVAQLAQRSPTLAEERFIRLCRAEATALRKSRKDLPTRSP